jgi:hypothetical protein
VFFVLIVLLQVVYSYAFGIFFFHEHLTLFGVAGTALIALGMACVTARTPPQQQQQQQQGDKLSEAARDAAGAGLGSRMFSRILQLEPEQQQQQQQSGSEIRGSGSFLARMQSFQRLLADRRSGGGLSGGVNCVQYDAAGSSEAEGAVLLPVAQERSSGPASSGHTTAAAAAADGVGGTGSWAVTNSLLAVDENSGDLSNWQGRVGHAAAMELAVGVAHDVELATTGGLQHRHLHWPQQQQQQQQPLFHSTAAAAPSPALEAAETAGSGCAVTVADGAFHAVLLKDSMQPLWAVGKE